MREVKTKFVRVVVVQDPDTLEGIELEVHKDPESGALLAVDSSFLDQVEDTIPSPFNADTRLRLSVPNA